MKKIHIECTPDELLVSKLGITKKHIVHHAGKYRIVGVLNKKKIRLP